MTTYPEMNAEIVRILRACRDPHCTYAATCIEELEAQVKRLRETIEDVATDKIRTFGRRSGGFSAYRSGSYLSPLFGPAPTHLEVIEMLLAAEAKEK